MEELKHEQEMRERRNQNREQWRDRHTENSAQSSRFDELPDDFDPSGRPGSFDDGDTQTTNLYVGNLSPQVDENFLLHTFGRFGPIASVKIMWPRTEEERRRQRNCGFVSFMNRADAQAATDEMEGYLHLLDLNVVEVLTESLTLKETPIPTKVSRLMLVSDILHNSSAPVKNASAYRTKFESSLPDIMESFNDLYRNITGRITAEALKERVLKVLQVWADWFLFSDAYVNGLRATFLRTGNSGLAPFHFLCGDAPEVEQRTSSDDAGDGGKVNPDGALAIGKGAAMKELLSLPLTELERRCRHNGLSMVGGTATMVARLLYLEEAEKQRGHELDEDLKFASHSSSARFPSTQKDSTLSWIGWLLPNGIVKWIMTYNSHKESLYLPPLTNSAPHYKSIDFSSEDKSETILPTSKWAREDDESDDEQKRSSRDLGLTYSSSGSENAGDGLSKIKDAELTTDTSNSAYPESGMTEELRQKLRRLEVALIEYRESLEEQGIKSSDEIESKVEIHWQRLQSEYGLLNFSGDTSTKGGRSSVERREKRDYSREASEQKWKPSVEIFQQRPR